MKFHAQIAAILLVTLRCSAEGGYMNIPCDTVESQASSEWLWVAFPHELTHYFLLQEFPDRKFDIRARAWHLEGMSSITISLPDMHNSRTDSGFYELQRERYET